MYRSQSGFTLIELVIVIVILGILSAFALPRFADLSGDARSASLEGAAGAMSSAKSITQSTCVVREGCNKSQGTGESVDIEGGTINLEFGYPAATTETSTPGGIAAAAQLSDNDYDISTNSDGGVVVTFPDTASGECEAAYTAPASDDAPEVTVNDTGC